MQLNRSYKIIIGIVVGALLLWAIVLPLVSQKQSNEKLSDIPRAATVKGDVMQPQAQASVPMAEEPKELSRGVFTGINRQSGSGDVTLLKQGDKYYIRLESNFNVSSGPDLMVAVGKGGQVLALVGPLKGTSGGQNYELPASIGPATFDQVLIHCRAFKYSFARADLVER